VLELYGWFVFLPYIIFHVHSHYVLVFGDLRLINSETIGVIIYNGFYG
jgi:hypothetical protein